jgi:dextranase
VSVPAILAFGPLRSWGRPGQMMVAETRICLDPGAAATATLELLDLDVVVARSHRRLRAASASGVAQGDAQQDLVLRLRLPGTPRHGYGLRLRIESGARAAVATSAVEALEGWWEAPRHAALTDFDDPGGTAAAVRGLRDWHVTVVQHYDWMWRHYRYRPPGGREVFVDSLGRSVSHAAVRAGIRAGHGVAIASLAYGSVYGAEAEHVRRHPNDRVFDASGEPLSLGGTFFINDLRPASAWRRRLLREYRAAIRAYGFDGIHMDTYGHPHHAVAADGERLDFASLYPGLVAEAAREVAESRPGARVLFNCVDGFPLDVVARAPTTALYLELWPPDRGFADVVRWITRARERSGGRAVVIAAYAAALRSRPRGTARRRAVEASLLLGTVIAVAGAFHHTLAEGDRLLVEGYYPSALPMRPPERSALQALWRFGARYLHLVSDPARRPMDSAGLRIDDEAGNEVDLSHEPRAGRLWATAWQMPDGRRVLHLVDLRDQASDHWDEPRQPSPLVRGLRLDWPDLRRPFAATPWHRRGDAVPLVRADEGPIWRLPPFRRWLLVTDAP